MPDHTLLQILATLKSILVECAHAAGRTKGTYLSAQYARLARRKGKKRAAVAVGHTILEAVTMNYVHPE